jgi:hypothetical protein
MTLLDYHVRCSKCEQLLHWKKFYNPTDGYCKECMKLYQKQKYHDSSLPEGHCNIYFLEVDFDGKILIKIGRTIGTVKGRIGKLSTGIPFNKSVLFSFVGTPEDETQLKQRFAKYNVDKEWFRPVLDIYAYCFRKEKSEKARTGQRGTPRCSLLSYSPTHGRKSGRYRPVAQAKRLLLRLWLSLRY